MRKFILVLASVIALAFQMPSDAFADYAIDKTNPHIEATQPDLSALLPPVYDFSYYDQSRGIDPSLLPSDREVHRAESTPMVIVSAPRNATAESVLATMKNNDLRPASTAELIAFSKNLVATLLSSHCVHAADSAVIALGANEGGPLTADAIDINGYSPNAYSRTLKRYGTARQQPSNTLYLAVDTKVAWQKDLTHQHPRIYIVVDANGKEHRTTAMAGTWTLGPVYIGHPINPNAADAESCILR